MMYPEMLFLVSFESVVGLKNISINVLEIALENAIIYSTFPGMRYAIRRKRTLQTSVKNYNKTGPSCSKAG